MTKLNYFFVVLMTLALLSSTIAPFCHAGADCSTVLARNMIDQSNAKSIIERIEANKITSVDELMDHFSPITHQNYALVFASRSRQRSSPKFPRIILQDKNTMIGIAGDKSMEGGNLVEILEFDPVRARFNAYSIEFSDRGGLPHVIRNPKQCIGCHSKAYHPIWDGYPLWRGAFGGRDIGTMNAPVHPTEDKYVKQFLATQTGKGRYRNLLPHHGEADEIRNISQYNNTFSYRIYQMNFHRIAREIFDSPKYAKYRDALRQSFLTYNAEDVIKRMPGDFKKLMAEYAQFKSAQDKLNDAFVFQLVQDYTKALKISPRRIPELISGYEQVIGPGHADLLLFIAQKMGLETDTWATNLANPSLYGTTTGGNYNIVSGVSRFIFSWD